MLAFTVVDNRAVAIGGFNDPELLIKVNIGGITVQRTDGDPQAPTLVSLGWPNTAWIEPSLA